MSDITTALTTALTTVKTDFFTALGDILPLALAIVGAGLVVTLGIRYFKQISQNRS